MTEERRALVDLGRKSAEPNSLNELLQHSIQRLKECERANDGALDALKAELRHTAQLLMECRV